MSGDRTVEVHPDPDDLVEAAFARFSDVARRSVEARGRFAVALAGGSTPRPLYERLAARPEATPWESTEVFWGDERCVPPDHDDSNVRMAREALLDRVPVPDDRVHPVPTEEPDPEVAAALYERTLRRVLAPPGDAAPRLDLVLLGLGPDGHTASLFPHASTLEIDDRLVAAVRASEPTMRPPVVDRITLTLPALDAARFVVFLVAGAEKAGAVTAVLADDGNDDTWPARRVRPDDGETLWLLDEAAAGEIA